VSLRDLANVTARLHYSLRDQILGYATYVEDAAEDLFAGMGFADVPVERINTLVYVAGVWRLWQIVNGQISILDNALALLATSGVNSVQLGQTFYSGRSEGIHMLVELRDDLGRVLAQQGLSFVATSRTLRALARNVMDENGT
jgi:hypothetical protein